MNKLPAHLEELSPSENAARNLLLLARQIAKRDELKEEEIFSQNEIIEICEKEKLGRKDKLKSIRVFLEKQRFPERAKIEKELESCLDLIRKEHSLKLKLPRELEGDSLEMTLSFKNLSELKDMAKNLENLSSSKDLDKIFEILSGRG